MTTTPPPPYPSLRTVDDDEATIAEEKPWSSEADEIAESALAVINKLKTNDPLAAMKSFIEGFSPTESVEMGEGKAAAAQTVSGPLLDSLKAALKGYADELGTIDRQSDTDRSAEGIRARSEARTNAVANIAKYAEAVQIVAEIHAASETRIQNSVLQAKGDGHSLELEQQFRGLQAQMAAAIAVPQVVHQGLESFGVIQRASRYFKGLKGFWGSEHPDLDAQVDLTVANREAAKVFEDSAKAGQEKAQAQLAEAKSLDAQRSAKKELDAAERRAKYPIFGQFADAVSPIRRHRVASSVVGFAAVLLIANSCDGPDTTGSIDTGSSQVVTDDGVTQSVIPATPGLEMSF